jgi:hypothetical protein
VHTGRELPHRVEVGQVEPAHLEAGAGLGVADLRDRPLALDLVAHGQHDVRAVAGQLSGGGQAEAAIGPGDDERAAAQIGYPVGGPAALCHESHTSSRRRT